MFRSRYKSILIEKEQYYNNVFRYINQNYIRTGICQKVENYPGGVFYHLVKTNKSKLNPIGNKLFNIQEICNILGISDIKDILEWLNEAMEHDISSDQK